MMARRYRQAATQFGGAVLFVMMATAGAHSGHSHDASEVQQTVNVQTALKHSGDDRLTLLSKLQQEIPDDPSIAARLAHLYIQQAREQSASHYYKKAHQAIRAWGEKSELPTEIALVKAVLYQHDHHYAEASELLRQVIQKQPKNSQAWLTLASIQLVQGEYAKAAVSCDALSRVASTWFGGICYSQIYSVTGRAKEAYQMQEQLLAQLGENQRELRIWVTALMAESSLRHAQNDLAERHYKAVLSLRPHDVHALRNYSDFLLRNHRSQEVIPLLENYAEHDALLLRTALAAKAVGDKVLEAESVASLKLRFANASSRHGHTHEKEEALFHLNFSEDKTQALGLTQRNWDLQKEPSDAITVLQAALVNQQPESAKQVIAWVNKHRLEDPYIHALIDQIHSH